MANLGSKITAALAALDLEANSTDWARKINDLLTDLVGGQNPFGTAALKNTGTGGGQLPELDAFGKLPASVLPVITGNELHDQVVADLQAADAALTKKTADNSDAIDALAADATALESRADFKSITCVASEDVAAGDVLFITSMTGTVPTVAKTTTASAVADFNNSVCGIAHTSASNGAQVVVIEMGYIASSTTLTWSRGDKVFLDVSANRLIFSKNNAGIFVGEVQQYDSSTQTFVFATVMPRFRATLDKDIGIPDGSVDRPAIAPTFLPEIENPTYNHTEYGSARPLTAAWQLQNPASSSAELIFRFSGATLTAEAAREFTDPTHKVIAPTEDHRDGATVLSAVIDTNDTQQLTVTLISPIDTTGRLYYFEETTVVDDFDNLKYDPAADRPVVKNRTLFLPGKTAGGVNVRTEAAGGIGFEGGVENLTKTVDGNGVRIAVKFEAAQYSVIKGHSVAMQSFIRFRQGNALGTEKALIKAVAFDDATDTITYTFFDDFVLPSLTPLASFWVEVRPSAAAQSSDLVATDADMLSVDEDGRTIIHRPVYDIPTGSDIDGRISGFVKSSTFAKEFPTTLEAAGISVVNGKVTQALDMPQGIIVVYDAGDGKRRVQNQIGYRIFAAGTTEAAARTALADPEFHPIVRGQPESLGGGAMIEWRYAPIDAYIPGGGGAKWTLHKILDNSLSNTPSDTEFNYPTGVTRDDVIGALFVISVNHADTANANTYNLIENSALSLTYSEVIFKNETNIAGDPFLAKVVRASIIGTDGSVFGLDTLRFSVVLGQSTIKLTHTVLPTYSIYLITL